MDVKQNYSNPDGQEMPPPTESVYTSTAHDKIKSENKDEGSVSNGKEPPEEPDLEYPSVLKAVIIIASLFLTVFLVALDQTIIGTAIPKITDQFHSVGDVGWYGSAYFLTSTALQPTYGRIYKILNVQWVHPALYR
jgi:hypothetical protein